MPRGESDFMIRGMGRGRKAIDVRVIGPADEVTVDYVMPEIVLSGNTYPIKSQLEFMNFKWVPSDRTWRYHTTDRGTVASVVNQVMRSGDCRIVNAWVECLCRNG